MIGKKIDEKKIELLRRAHHDKKSMKKVSEEDYIEAIYEVQNVYGYAKLKDISNILGVKPSSVTDMVKKLEEKGFVNYMRYRGIVLTDKGVEIAKRISETHSFLRKFLIGLGIDEERANVEAELIEHFISKDTLEKLKEFYEKCKK